MLRTTGWAGSPTAEQRRQRGAQLHPVGGGSLFRKRGNRSSVHAREEESCHSGRSSGTSSIFSPPGAEEFNPDTDTGAINNKSAKQGRFGPLERLQGTRLKSSSLGKTEARMFVEKCGVFMAVWVSERSPSRLLKLRSAPLT